MHKKDFAKIAKSFFMFYIDIRDYINQEINSGNVTSDIMALSTNAEAVSPARLSKRTEIIAATAEPGNATNNTNFTMSADDRPIAVAIPNITSG